MESLKKTDAVTVLREALNEIITNHGNWNNGMWAANVAREALKATERAAIQTAGMSDLIAKHQIPKAKHMAELCAQPIPSPVQEAKAEQAYPRVVGMTDEQVGKALSERDGVASEANSEASEPKPERIEMLNDYWMTRVGALDRWALYCKDVGYIRTLSRFEAEFVDAALDAPQPVAAPSDRDAVLDEVVALLASKRKAIESDLAYWGDSSGRTTSILTALASLTDEIRELRGKSAAPVAQGEALTLSDKHQLVIRKAADAVRDRGHSGDARLADSLMGILAKRTGSTA